MTAALRRVPAEEHAGGEDGLPSPVAFTLPAPPSANNLFRNLPGKGRVQTADYLDWRAQARTALMIQRVPAVQGRVIVLAGIERHSGQADIDNRLKAMLDALVSAGIISDDRMVTFVAPFWMPKANHLAHVAIYQCQRMTLTFHPSQDGASGALVVEAPQHQQDFEHEVP